MFYIQVIHTYDSFDDAVAAFNGYSEADGIRALRRVGHNAGVIVTLTDQPRPGQQPFDGTGYRLNVVRG